jgi:hypothetical protein
VRALVAGEEVHAAGRYVYLHVAALGRELAL